MCIWGVPSVSSTCTAAANQSIAPAVLAVGAVGLPGVPARLELGEARLPALAHASEEVLVGVVEVADGLLERHGVHLREPRGLGVALPRRDHLDQIIGGDTLPGLAVGGLLDIEDERSAGFFAIGLSLQGGGPAAVCCTSGSALLNLHPAVAEAFYQQVPLIVISADRPAAWIGQMDGQTPVSYTHLDVYKRQIHDISHHPGSHSTHIHFRQSQL